MSKYKLLVTAGKSGVLLPFSKIDEIETFVFVEKPSYGSEWKIAGTLNDTEIKVVLAKDYPSDIEQDAVRIASDKAALLSKLKAKVETLEEELGEANGASR